MSTPSPEKSPVRPPRRWRRRLLRTAVILTTIITAFYVEENWRCARAWNNVKAALEARHEPLTMADLFRPVPDEENFFAAPVVQECFRDTKKNWLACKDPYDPMRRAVDEAGADKSRPDLPAVLKFLREQATWSLPPVTGRPGPDILALLSPAEPDLRRLREALNRPRAQLLPWQTDGIMSGGAKELLREGANLCRLRHMALLAEGRLDEACDECVQVIRLAWCLSQKPAYLIQYLNGVILCTRALEMLRLESDAIPWRISHLQTLDAELARLHFSEKYEDVLRAERVYALAYLESLGPYEVVPGGGVPFPPGARLFPSGWRLKWKASMCDALQQSIDGIAAGGLRSRIGRKLDTGWFPPQPFAGRDHKDLDHVKMFPAFLAQDASVLRSRLALAALRWRLEKNVWPESLTSLGAYFPSGIPDDPLSGLPFTGAAATDDTYIIKSPEAGAGGAEDESVIKIKPPVRASP